MNLRVTKSGMLATIQDAGRYGLMSQGFSPAGAMDSWSYRAANILVGNSENAATLEFCLMGPSFRVESAADEGSNTDANGEIGRSDTSTENADEELIVAFTGAGFQPSINGKPAPLGAALVLHPGDELSAGNAQAGKGTYGYLAVRGGFDVPLAFGSASTSLKYQVGGFYGRALAVGDILSTGHRTQSDVPDVVLPEWLRISNILSNEWAVADAPSSALTGATLTDATSATASARKYASANAAQPITIHMVPCAQERLFTPRGIETFYGSVYTITPESDRMGLRLDGSAVEALSGSDIISDGIPFGAVQIPASGMPIIMMADRQTTGGYAKIATVASADIAKLAQCPTGAKLRFVRTSIEEAQNALAQKEKAFTTWAKGASSPQQLLDHLQWQCKTRGLPSMEYRGPHHRAFVEPYSLQQVEQQGLSALNKLRNRYKTR